jgi:hypothetical protein
MHVSMHVCAYAGPGRLCGTCICRSKSISVYMNVEATLHAHALVQDACMYICMCVAHILLHAKRCKFKANW